MKPDEVNGRIRWYFLMRVHEPLKYICGVCKTDLIYNSCRIWDGITKNSCLPINNDIVKEYNDQLRLDNS